jgi:hypothetical protein
MPNDNRGRDCGDAAEGKKHSALAATTRSKKEIECRFSGKL